LQNLWTDRNAAGHHLASAEAAAVTAGNAAVGDHLVAAAAGNHPVAAVDHLVAATAMTAGKNSGATAAITANWDNNSAVTGDQLLQPAGSAWNLLGLMTLKRNKKK
jgi:hypothetical protein